MLAIKVVIKCDRTVGKMGEEVAERGRAIDGWIEEEMRERWHVRKKKNGTNKRCCNGRKQNAFMSKPYTEWLGHEMCAFCWCLTISTNSRTIRWRWLWRWTPPKLRNIQCAKLKIEIMRSIYYEFYFTSSRFSQCIQIRSIKQCELSSPSQTFNMAQKNGVQQLAIKKM